MSKQSPPPPPQPMHRTDSGHGNPPFAELQAYRSGLRPSEIADELHKLVATRRRGLWLICRYLADLAASDGYAALDYRSVHAFAWRELGMTRDQVNRKMRVGRALRSLPRIEEAFVLGDIGFARVREIVRVATPASEGRWLDLARRLSRRDLEEAVARARGVREAVFDDEDCEDEDEAAAQTGDPGDYAGSAEWVRVRVPARLWERMARAMELVCRLEGANLDETEALGQVADAAMAQLQSQVLLSQADAANDDAGTGTRPMGREGGHGAPEERAERPALMAVGAACPGRGLPPATETVRPMGRAGPGAHAPEDVSEIAQEVWGALDHLARAADTILEATRLNDPPTVLAAISELEIMGYVEKVAGGWRRVRRQAE